MQNECIPLYRPGQDITAKASVALTGRRLVAISGNRTGGPDFLIGSTVLDNVYQVGLPALGGRVFGVAGYDTPAAGYCPIKREGILPVEAAAAINAWQEVMSDATGRVIPYASAGGQVPCGVAMTGCASGGFAEIELYKSGAIV